ncbi:AAA family ATPase [Myxococcota bacterium]|nr:AAA family ATPase [Myxococcota bacterium]
MSESVAPAPSAPLTLDVLVLLREEWSGDHVALPLADPSIAARGTAEEALRELELFLQDHLSRVPAEVLARFSMPPSTYLVGLDVAVARADLPRRLEVDVPITFTAVVIPFGTDLWVHVPKLEHTFFVARSEVGPTLFTPAPGARELEVIIEAEIERLTAALELEPAEYLELLPAKRERIERITVPVERAERAPEGRVASLKKRLAEHEKKKAAFEVLSSVALPLHARAESRHGPELVGRDTELATLTSLLGGRDRQSAVLVGAELSGKTALVLAWLRAEHTRGRTPLVFSTSGAQLVAGMSGLGQWQERLRRVAEAASELDAILYFEDLGDLFGDRTTGAIDLAGGLKPWIQDGRLRVLGELTPEGLTAHERRHAGFFAALGRVRIEPLGAAEAKLALERRITFDQERDPDRPTLSADAIQTIVDLTERYAPYRPFPGKALRFYDEIRAGTDHFSFIHEKSSVIGTDRVLEVFSTESGIPVFLLREDRALHADRVAAEFEKRLVGQRSAIQRVVETICVVKAQLQPAGKPLATFLFVGPTGVGKTELARTLATYLFGSADRMVRFDMSEYADPWAAERLIRGTDRAEGLLTKRVRQQPFTVLLLDEIEKAHPAVFDLLLQVAGEGRLTDARGRTAYFHNTIIILTSNVGASHGRRSIGIDAAERRREERYVEEVHKTFRPELVNRLDRIITFHALSPEEVEAVARMHLGRLASRRGLAEAGVAIDVSPEALSAIARAGYSEAYGARALRRHVEDHVVAPIARLLARHSKDTRGAEVKVLVDARGQLVFELFRSIDPRTRRDERGGAEVLALRREADRWLGLARVEHVREQLAFIASQLAGVPGAKAADEDEDTPKGRGDRRSASELAHLRLEHHRLQQLVDEAERRRQDLMTAEELTIGALYEGADLSDYLDEARRAHAALKRGLVHLLVAEESPRDEVTLLLQELDEGRGFDLWLVPLLEQLDARGWTAEVSFERDRTPPIGAWPPSRPFGPPRPLTRALDVLKGDARTTNVLVRVRGPYAGVLLALERGLHRFVKLHPEVNPVHLLVHVVAMRWELTDTDWSSGAAAPPLVDPTVDQTRVRATREHDGTHDRLLVAGKSRVLVVPIDDYWARFEEIALEHLLALEAGELDRAQSFISLIDQLQS